MAHAKVNKMLSKLQAEFETELREAGIEGR